jgi:hypothetical protein
MSIPFNGHEGLIIVPVWLWGQGGSGFLHCALDTGSTNTLISAAALEVLGYELAAAANHVQVTTASGVQLAPQISVQRVRALGNDHQDFRSSVTPCRPARAWMDSWVWTFFAVSRSPLIFAAARSR